VWSKGREDWVNWNENEILVGIMVEDIDLGSSIIEISNDVGVLRSVWKGLSSTMKNV
jgi:hypothetical protein